MARRVLLILNPAACAGRAARDLSEARSRLERAGCVVSWRETAGPGDATAIAAAAAGGGEFDVMTAAGGDGTAREVCSGVLKSARPDQAVALMPLGTGNDLAHVAGTGTLPDAVRAVAAGTPRPFDAIEVECTAGKARVVTHAFCFAAVGLAADVVRLTTPKVKKLFGPRLCYSVGFFRALADYRPVAARVTSDAGDHAGDYLLICAGNTSHAGGRMMPLSPGAAPHDGALDLSLIRATSRVEVALQFIRLLRGTHVRHRRATYFRSREIAVTTATPAEVQLDGDSVGLTPARFTVRPGALRLITAG
ncbi:MAG: diacylglycerol/lipid kinase family protein [Opitutaceae bacterium]